MGCGYSKTESDSDPVVSRAAAQSYFNLDGLPLSLTVVPKERGQLQLRVVGLDCVEELLLLDAALQKRELALRSATLLRIGNHVDQTFELMPHKLMVNHNPLSSLNSPSKQKANEVKVESVTPESAQTDFPEAEAAIRGVGTGELVKLAVSSTIKGGERARVMETIKKIQHRLVCAKLKTADITMLSSDLYYIVPEGPSVQKWSIPELSDEFKYALFDQVQRVASSAGGMKKKKTFAAPMRAYNTPAPEDQPESDNVVDQINARSAAQPKLLPIPLQEKQRELEYEIHGPSGVGMVIQGFEKYVGIGLVQRSLRAMLGYRDDPGSIPLVLEMRTFFLPEKHSVSRSQGQLAQISHRLHNAVVGSASYAHFVTWLDISSRTWTIDRVYLNGILPAGKKYGSKAIAEHLLAPQDLFFPKGESGSASEREWMGSFMESIPDLETLVVSDIINWNTYMLMAIVSSADRSGQTLVGDVLEVALQTELNNARLTKEQLQTLPVLDVFQRTVLGKMCSDVLKQWNARLGRNIKMESAEVTFGEGDEDIFGQKRPRMAVIMKLSSTKRESFARAQTRLDLAGETVHKAEEYVHIADHKAENTGETETGEGSMPSDGRREVKRTKSLPRLAERNKNLLHADVSSSSHNPSRPASGAPSQAVGHAHAATLEGMGANLETSFASGPPMNAKKTMMKDSESLGADLRQVITSSRLYFVGVSSAMCLLLHELQCERGLSCRAAAAAAEKAFNEQGAAIAKERLRLQRINSDKAVGQLLDLLKLAFSLLETGTIEHRHKAVLDLQQSISIGTMVQRGLVDDAIEHGIESWSSRYLTVCTAGRTGYHVLIGKLLGGIVQAIEFASEGVDNKEEQETAVHRCDLLLRSKEHVGQMRALVAAKGSARYMPEQDVGAGEMVNGLRKGSEMLMEIIEKEHIEWSSPMNKLLIKDALTEIHESYDKEISDSSYSTPPERAVAWFEMLTDWIDAAYDQIQEEIEVLGELMPAGNAVAQPAPTVLLRDRSKEQVGLAVGDEDVRQFISDFKAQKFSKVVVMAGAGISVSANLPDFRSPGGLYDQLRKQTNISAPETIFTAGFLHSNPELFFEVVQKLRTDHVKPTLTHCFIKELAERKILRRCYTQNIDCLERKANVPEQLLVECHGTTAGARCHKCQKAYDKDFYFNWQQSDGSKPVPRCQACAGLLRPNIVLFGESLAGGFQEKSEEDFKDADLLIIMGTSLQVQPFASLPQKVKSSCTVLVINLEMPNSLRLHRQVRSLRNRVTGTKLKKEVFLQGDCDTSIRWLAKEVGWLSRLEETFAAARS